MVFKFFFFFFFEGISSGHFLWSFLFKRYSSSSSFYYFFSSCFFLSFSSTSCMHRRRQDFFFFFFFFFFLEPRAQEGTVRAASSCYLQYKTTLNPCIFVVSYIPNVKHDTPKVATQECKLNWTWSMGPNHHRLGWVE
jgi:hypothetical protein